MNIKITASALMSLLRAAHEGHGLNELMKYAESSQGVVAAKISLGGAPTGTQKLSPTDSLLDEFDSDSDTASQESTGLVRPQNIANTSAMTAAERSNQIEKYFSGIVHKMIYDQTKGIFNGTLVDTIAAYCKSKNIIPSEQSILAAYAFMAQEVLSSAPALNPSVAQGIMDNNLRSPQEELKNDIPIINDKEMGKIFNGHHLSNQDTIVPNKRPISS